MSKPKSCKPQQRKPQQRKPEQRRKRARWRTYLVEWAIEVGATSPRHAARIAHEIHQDPDSFTTHYSVSIPGTMDKTIEVDL